MGIIACFKARKQPLFQGLVLLRKLGITLLALLQQLRLRARRPVVRKKHKNLTFTTTTLNILHDWRLFKRV